jgi:ADP-ribose pyrophosphatase YjhB (NUDIX family)
MVIDILKKIFLVTIGRFIPSDVFAQRHPVSTKGILFHDNKILLLKNEHKEWDLPGGKLDKKETLENCLKREIKEETNLDVGIQKLIGATINNVVQKIEVVILFYLCDELNDVTAIKLSPEHFDLGFFSKADIPSLNINQEYKQVILKAFDNTTGDFMH